MNCLLILVKAVALVYESCGDNVYCDEVVVGKCATDREESPAQMEKFQKDGEVPVLGASKESAEASGVQEFDLENQLEIIVHDGSETPVHDPRDLLVPDIDSGDQVVPEYLGDQGILEEGELVCDESDYDTEFPEGNLADQVTNLQTNNEENSTGKRSARRGETGLEVTNDEGAETCTQVAEDPVVNNSQNDAPGQGGGEDHLEMLHGDIADLRTKEKIFVDIMREKLCRNIPPR